MRFAYERPTIRDRIYALLDFFEAAYIVLCVIVAICLVVYAFL